MLNHQRAQQPERSMNATRRTPFGPIGVGLGALALAVGSYALMLAPLAYASVLLSVVAVAMAVRER